jgi:hypothetical protein
MDSVRDLTKACFAFFVVIRRRIPDVLAEQQAPIVALVEQILAAKKAPVGFDSAQPTDRSLSGVEGNIPALEAEIDRLVYALYGLTEEEIVVVEGKI